MKHSENLTSEIPVCDLCNPSLRCHKLVSKSSHVKYYELRPTDEKKYIFKKCERGSKTVILKSIKVEIVKSKTRISYRNTNVSEFNTNIAK